MLFYIWAAEDMYQGLHGIEDYGVFECKDIEEADYIGCEMSLDVISSYGLECQYYDDEEEDDDVEYDCREHTVWEVFKIKDEYVDLGINELNALCRQDPKEFVEKFTEEVDF